MQFNLASQETYITEAKLSSFERIIKAILQHWGLSGQVAASAALTVLDVHARVSSLPNKGEGNDFIVVTDPLPHKKCRFAYYDFYLHARVKSVCYQLAKALLEVAAKVPSFDQSLLKQLWALVRETILADDSNLSAYLYACNVHLPTVLCDEERPSIIERSTGFILSTYKSSPTSWKTELASVAQQLARHGLLSTILCNEVIPPKITKYLLVEYGTFASEEARQSLKDETFAADADARATGLIVWLAKASETDSCSLMAEAMSFAASRVKNESGIHRRTVLAWLESNFADKVVRKSLEDNTSAAKSHEMLCSAILDMQKNDLSRLDCVGRQVCFPRLPKYILDTVLEFDPSRLHSERRQLWADCAVQMDWNLKAAMGDEELACYEWPIGRHSELQSASWISRDAFEAAYPTSRTSTAGKITQLRKHVNLSYYLHKDFKKENVFGPAQCVQMLECAIGKVWINSLPVCALRTPGHFPDDKDVSTAWLERILVLYRLCGMSWQEVELLNTVFDSVFDALGDVTAKEQDLLRASSLLETLFGIHKSSFSLIPKLAQACDKLFRHSVAADKAHFVESWLPCWRMVYQESGRRVWDSPVDDRLQNFLDRYALGCEPDAWRPVLSKSDRVLKECRMARELLQMSPSALRLADVRDVLFTRRQDALLRFVRDPVPLYGVFGEEETAETIMGALFSEFSESDEPEHECESVDEILFQWLDEEALLSCHADVSIAYARFARTQASSTRIDLSSKIEAISKFMGAPSTQHTDVLAALQSNLDDAVRESLINRVFKLDSPWHILGHLLSQKTIEKNDQRITSSLLRYVAQHVHIDKVVSVADLLLKNPRRRKLSFQLHKGVICLLFDAKTPEAMKLLGVEWRRANVPDGVRILIAEKCVQSIASGETEGWEVSVLSDIATNPVFQPELKFWLLAAQSPYAPVLNGVHQPVGVEKDEVLERFRVKGPSRVIVHSSAALDKFRSILHEFQKSPPTPSDENGTLLLLAELKRWELSPSLFMDPPRDDPVTLDEMVALLTRAVSEGVTDLPDHPTQVARTFCAQLFSRAVIIQLNHDVEGKVKDKNQEESSFLNELVDGSDAARKFQACVRTLLDAVLDMPVRQQIPRQLVLHLVNTLIEGIQSDYRPGAIRPNALLHHLIAKPFAKEWKLLKQDSKCVNEVLDNLVVKVVCPGRGRL